MQLLTKKCLRSTKEPQKLGTSYLSDGFLEKLVMHHHQYQIGNNTDRNILDDSY